MAKQAVITAESVLSELKSKVYAPVYFLMGEEPYYIDVISDYIQNNVLDEMEREFDQTVLYGKETDMRTVINAAKRYPMTAQYQVVIVKEAQLIKDWDNLVFYLQQPSKSTILVFCYKYGVPDGRKKWFTMLKATGIVFESPRIRDYEINAWISRYAKSKGLAIDEKASFMLAEYLGTDLSKIANELDKLMITKPADSVRITPDLIEKNIGISKDYNVFELQAALINRDVLKANRIVLYFAENKKANPLVMVLSQLFNFFSNLMLFHYLPDKSQMAVASELKINPYFVKDYQKAAQVFNAWKTMFIISYIRETDARSKGIDNVSADEGDLLKELVFKILH
ncbi:DNA polymerase III subunit delta [Paludibacter sp. 221]|uniref:DNA polymerase III subunit delta n=1 Tax=Paludibacter sp. 221 TaxID=2302939 RepID=UPI0013D80ED7|nr:DNA polymerase III subunit delta [Paludibacter sp. 221]NDV47483.1 DNA polymerase III subunit delta [Paludibacter sp. 221]